MPKLQSKKLVLQHTQNIRDLLFNAQQQLIGFTGDVLNFYYHGDEKALTIRAQNITSTINEAQSNLQQFHAGYEPYSSRSSERHFSDTAEAYETAVQQKTTLFSEALADLQILEEVTEKLRTIANRAEPLAQYIDSSDLTKIDQLSDQLQVLIKSCKEITAGQTEPLKLAQSRQVYESLLRMAQTLAEQYGSAKQQLSTDPSQYMTTVNYIQPAQLFDSSSFESIFTQLLQQPDLDEYQQAVDQLYYQS